MVLGATFRERGFFEASESVGSFPPKTSRPKARVVDESGFSLRVIRRKNWGQKGQRKNIAGQRRRGRVNVVGAIRESERKRICFYIKIGNADIFLAQLQQFNQLLEQEWVNKGNRSVDFQSPGAKIILILDNAIFHKRQDILIRPSKELPNFGLNFYQLIALITILLN